MKKALLIAPLLIAGAANAAAPQVEIAGGVEFEASYADNYETGHTSDLVISEATLEFGAEINKNLNATVIGLYEQGAESDHLLIDEAFINYSKDNYYLNAGKSYLPFGLHETNFISDPVTLESGEIGQTFAEVGAEFKGLSFSAYAFKSANSEDSEKVRNYGANIAYTYEKDETALTLGVSAISNIMDGGAFALVDGSDNEVAATKDVMGHSAYAKAGHKGFGLIAEYVAADKVKEQSLEGKEMTFLQLEASYGFSAMGKDLNVAVGYQATEEAGGVLPETTMLAGIGMDINENNSIAFEYKINEDYSVADGGTGKDANSAALTYAVAF